MVCGSCITGGDIVAIFTTDKTGYREDGSTYTKPDALKRLVIVLAAHEVEAIDEITSTAWRWARSTARAG